jgi:uncharacterized membrane protein
MKKYFLTGLALLLPLAVTIGIVVFVVDLLTKPFMGVVASMLEHTNLQNFRIGLLTPVQVVRYTSQFIILVGLFIVTLLLGIITRWFIFKAFFSLSDKILHRIPLVNKVYKTTQDIIKTLFASDKNSFKQVVLVPFPYQGTYSVGLVARESPEACEEAAGKKMVSVFVPTTPNPTTGFLLMYETKDLVYLDIKTEEAIKYVVSCGVIIPEKKS